MLIFRFSLICLILTIMGCKSTSYSDDYAQHQNSLSGNDSTKNLIFSLAGDQNIDLRGTYKNDDTVDSSSILYAGDAGLVGMLLQIGIHSASIDAQRDSRLSQAQTLANGQVSALIGQVKRLEMGDLMGDYQALFTENSESRASKVFVKPIFFSNPKKTQLHLRMVAYIPKTSKKKSKEPQFKYRNSIQVFGKELNKEESEMLLASDSAFLQTQLSQLMQMGLFVINKDVKGLFKPKPKNKKSAAKTYIIGGDSQIVYRGRLVQEHCDFHIIRDLHSWLIAFPKPVDESSDSEIAMAQTVKPCTI